MSCRLLMFVLFSTLFLSKGYAGYVLIDEVLYHSDELATYSEEDHYRLAVRAFDKRDYEEAARQFRILGINYHTSEDAWFFAGVSYYETCDLDFANSAFSKYLSCQKAPVYFEESVYYKLCIAERLAAGEKIHPIESRKLPKCIPAKTLALDIFDEVISLMPTSEFAEHALYRKGCLQWSFGLYKDAIATYQMLIRRFPKSEMTPDCYLNILSIYFVESRIEFQNPDIISFAEITLRKFEQEFPKDERLGEAEAILCSIKEVFASGLYNIAEFYMRTCHPRAATIYYQMVCLKFPHTKVARKAESALQVLCPDGIPIICQSESTGADEKFDFETL